VADVEHVHHLLLDREQDAIDVRATAVEKLPDLHWRPAALGRNGTPSRECLKGVNRCAKGSEPLRAGLSRLFAL
jgi:hypothetical protein